jgi:diguanylate cyclase (GGDEF)-like protein
VIETKLRTVDVVARCGADEYGLILPETGQTGASVAAERLRSGIAGIAWANHPLTACFGVAVLTPDVSSPEELAARAADALRCAKSLGANSIVNHAEMPQSVVKKTRMPRVKKIETSVGN